MGKIEKGILGGVSGKVGTVSGSSRNGVHYLRSLPGKSRHAATPTQLVQRARFKLAVSLVKSFGDLWKTSFVVNVIGLSAQNLATRSVLSRAITGIYPSLSIDYSRVLVSNGDLPNAVSPVASSATGGQLAFSWTDNTGAGTTRGDDRAILALYDPASGFSVYSTAGALRRDGKAVLDARHFAGVTVQTYLGFVSADGKKIAASIYTGEIKIAPLS